MKKELQKVQRQLAAGHRNELYKEIRVTHSDDKKLFYKIVNRQRSNGQPAISEIFIDDVYLSDVDMIRQGLASYFRKLASPQLDPNFDESYKTDIELRKLLIKNLCSQDSSETPEISIDQVLMGIRYMKNGKSADMSGLKAEHIKYGGGVLVECFTSIVDHIVST